jgi:beta-glucosidase
MVLLKNENHVLPLAKGTKVALFGKASADYVKGGGGSGDVTVPYLRTLLQGLAVKQKEEKVEVLESLAQFYEKNVKEQYESGAEPGMTVEPELPTQLLEEAKAFTDTAIISICRFSGEGWDRKTVLTGNYRLSNDEQKMFDLSSKLFEDGDFCLTHAERAMVDVVTENFAKVIVVLNIGGVMDTGWFRENDRIQGALLAWQGGLEGGLAEADILTGDVNPSGHLADTFAKTLEDYPSTAGFHTSADYVDYTEDIFVGYRYFETVPGAKEKVSYPFGYGLSYSDFLIMPVYCSYVENEIFLSVKVTNLSQMPGKAVVQVYAKCPEGRLGKSALSLVSFAKTGMLGSGVSQTIDMSFPVRCMASYDDRGAVQKSAWILEQGEYAFYVGGHVRDLTRVPYAWKLEENLVLEQLSERCAPKKLPKRMRPDGSYEMLETGEYPDRGNGLVPIPDLANDFPTPESPQVKRGQMPWSAKYQPHPERILLDDVADGKHSLDEFMDQLSVEELISLTGGQPNTGVANTFGWGNLPEWGVPNAMTADGPAGLRVEAQTGVKTTAWPCATLLACTWDQDLLAKVGRAAAEEVKENNCCVWLAPAVNIHRSPLCGRNFEYYSEDPLVAGLCAGALVESVQSQKVSACVKHFCANNKETNRKESDSHVSERALREIYLRAFELIVKRAHPWALMTSYNLVNGIHASENRDLLTGILREDWGFDGVVTTDWWTCGEHYLELKAGNDIKMGAGYPDRVKEAYEKGLISKEEISLNARRVLELLLKLC